MNIPATNCPLPLCLQAKVDIFCTKHALPAPWVVQIEAGQAAIAFVSATLPQSCKRWHALLVALVKRCLDPDASIAAILQTR